MPSKKKKKRVVPKPPRRRWKINPVTRVKESAKVYSRQKKKKEDRDLEDEV